MSIRLRPPSDDVITALHSQGEHDQLSYAPEGLLDSTTRPPGYRYETWNVALGAGDAVFDIATDALRTWKVHRASGLIVRADAPPRVGSIVVLSAPLPLGHIDAVCRVLSVLSDSNRFGFTYGTLSRHPERGEESFTVHRDDHTENGHDNRTVWFEIRAASQPAHWLARLAPPVARTLQRRATARYLEAMQALTTNARAEGNSPPL